MSAVAVCTSNARQKEYAINAATIISRERNRQKKNKKERMNRKRGIYETATWAHIGFSRRKSGRTDAKTWGEAEAGSGLFPSIAFFIVLCT
jgi:hypothetical protein